MSNQEPFSISGPDNNLYYSGSSLEFLQDVSQDMDISSTYMTPFSSVIDTTNNNIGSAQFIQQPSTSFFQPGLLDPQQQSQQQQSQHPQQPHQPQQQDHQQQQYFHGVLDNMALSQDSQFMVPSDNGLSYVSKPILKTVASMPNIKPTTFPHVTKTETSTPNTRKRIPAAKTQILEASFQKNPKPDRDSRDALSKETNLPIRNIQIWFQNRRAKARSKEEEMMAKTTGTEPLTGVDLNSTTELTQKPDRGHLSLNLVQSNLTNLKNVNPSYSFHQSHLTSPATTPSPSSLNHDTLYSANLSTSSLDTGLSSQEANSLKVSQNMAIVSGTTTADGNNFQQPVTFQKPQVLQTPYNNSMSAGSAKSVQQQYAYPQQPIIFTQPGAFAQTVQAPPMVIYNDQELLKLQQQQLQLQQQQLQQQHPQPMVIPQQFNFVNQQQQLKQFQQFQQYQQAQLRQQQQQQQQQQMAQRVQNPQFVFRQVPGGPASPQMPSPLSTTAQKPGQMFTSSPAASTSFQSTPLATTAAAIPTRQGNFRNQVPPGPRIRRSFSTSSPLSQTASSTVHKAPTRSTQKGPYIHANIHFSNTDLSSAVMSPNSPTFQVNQIPSPSTTISEIETYDDIASLASPIVSPFMPNMPAIRFPTDSKRPSQDYSVDEVASNGDHDLIEPTKRQRSNTQGSQIVRRLSSTSETSVRPVGDVTSPKSISSSPCNSSRKPLTPAPSANSTNDTHIAPTPSVPTIPATTSSSTVSAPTITTTTTMASNTTTKTLSTKKNAGRFNNTTIVRSPISGSFSTSTVSSAVAKKDNNKPTTSTFSVNIGSAGVSSFGSQGQQLVFPLNPVNGTNQFENESIATLSGNASTSANHGKETSFSGRSRANAQNANNGMGRFEVLTFHQYEKPMTPEDRRLKQKQKQQKNDSKDKTLKARSSTQAAKKRVSMVKEENEDIEKSFKKEENKEPGSDNLRNGRENPSMELMDSSMTVISTESTSSDSAPAETNTALTTTAASSGNSPLTIVPEIKSEPGVLAHDDIKPDNDVYMFDGDDTTIFTSSATVLDDEDFSNIMDYSFGGDHGTTGNLLMMHDPTIVDDNPVFLDDLTKYN